MVYEPLDPEYVRQRLTEPPFVTVPGVVNIRDLLGAYSTSHPGMTTKPGFLFRSGEISAVTEEGVHHHPADGNVLRTINPRETAA